MELGRDTAGDDGQRGGVEIARAGYQTESRPVSITGDHVKLREDGKAVFVISHQRPEALADDMNWLDTAGRKRGFMLLRWIDCPKVEAPEIRLAAIGDLWG